jgi:CRISPR-associated protein Csb1
MVASANEFEMLNFKILSDAVTGTAAAFRQITRLIPAGGTGSKVYPPTHSGGVYAWEKRRISEDEIVPTVLLDSVQSQANRMEMALLEAHRSGKIKIPLLQVDFSDDFPDIGIITTLDAPHRIADAIFRDCILNGKKFRESDVGMAFVEANIRNATGLFRYCPHALVFGLWDSAGSKGGLGNKFQRVVVSEIVGVQAESGVHTSSRIDPLGITRAAEVYETENGDWTLDPDEAKKNNKGDPIKSRPSEFLHGNIPPTIEVAGVNRSPLRGGVTMDYAVQTTLLSLPALRRLRFPIGEDEETERNDAARTVLASLALAAAVHMREQGYDLRSRCLLIPECYAPFELIENDGGIQEFYLDADTADKIFEQAVTRAKELGMPWQDDVINLEPENRLKELVTKSRISRSLKEE